MKNFFFLFCFLWIVSSQTEASEIKKIIYVTLDGVRWQDIVQNKKYFPLLWKNYASKMTIYGEPNHRFTMETASVPISLPSYQSQMTGAIQPCEENDCGQVRQVTVLENLIHTLKLKKKEIAVFSSWGVIGDAIESNRGVIYSNVGNIPVTDPDTGKPDAIMMKINKLQTLKAHIKINRLDEYTFQQALHYFEKHKPIFLWISLVNADNEAHDRHLKAYRNILFSYDRYLDSLFKKLRDLQLDKSTMVIITTDHGRGDNEHWITHGREFPESKRSFAFVYNGKLETYKNNFYKFSTLSIRPTIEKALLK